MNRKYIKTDCFGYSPITGLCTILSETCCAYGSCSFYKTQEQFNADKEKYVEKETEFRVKKKLG